MTPLEFPDKHNTMINVTTRIAVKVKNLPPFEFDWNDTRPQKPCSSLTVDDVLPCVADGDHLFKQAVQYVMHFLTQHFQSLKNLKVVNGLTNVLGLPLKIRKQPVPESALPACLSLAFSLVA